MDKNKFPKEIKKLLEQKQFKNLIAICLVLAFILLAMNVLFPGSKTFFSSSNNTLNGTASAEDIDKTKTPTKEDEKNYEDQQTADLKNILKKMDGVGDVEVMISFGNGEEKVPAYDKSLQNSKTEETDNQGGKRVNNQDTDTSKVVMTTSDGNNQPFILKTYKPKINGVIILAEGAENSKIKYEIEQAVSKLYNLSSDKVNVYSMKK
jgi:stage III sporulation protein AG